jgi:hypothetical protein
MKRSEVNITNTCYACCLMVGLAAAVWIVWPTVAPPESHDVNGAGIVEAVEPDLEKISELQREEINRLMAALKTADPDHPFVSE